jgi:hypothetical protein
MNHSDKARYLLYFGLVGFVSAVLLLFVFCKDYHEIVFRPRGIEIHLLKAERTRLRDSLANHADTTLYHMSVQPVGFRDSKDTSYALPRHISGLRGPDSVRKELWLALRYSLVNTQLHLLEYSTDTSFAGQFCIGTLFVDKDSLLHLYDSVLTKSNNTLRFVYNHDSVVSDLSVHAAGRITLRDSVYASGPIAFYEKYPGFGLWALLILFQFVACFILIPVSVITVQDVKGDLAGKYNVVGHHERWDFLTAFILVAVFGVVLELTVTLNVHMGDQVFLHGYNLVVGIYRFLVYLAAVCCFTGFLYTSRILGNMLRAIGAKTAAQKVQVVKRDALLSLSLVAAAPPTPEVTDLTSKIAQSDADMAPLKDDYARLRKYFSIFFVTSAFLLSMVVLQVGALYSATNSLDLVRFLTAPPAKYLIRPDFVYLFGGVYSLLLLIFYVPVKITMLNLENEIPSLVGDGSGKPPGWLSSFTGGLKGLTGVIAASSPLLIAIIQYIVQTFGGK